MARRGEGAGRDLPWDDLRLLGAVAEARSLPGAARLLGIDHSTVFRRLRQVEDGLGTPVFERGPEGYVPTAAGLEIVALARQVAEELGAVLRRVAGKAPAPSGEVRIASSDVLLSGLLLPLLAAFRAECPSVRLDLVAGNAALNLSKRDADVAIRATAAPPDTLVGRKAARIAWAPYAATTVSAEGEWVGFGDALAGLAAAQHLRDTVGEGRVGCRFDTVGGVLAGVAAGMGPGWLPCFVGDRAEGLRRLAPPSPALSADLWLLTHPDLRHAPRVRVLLDFLAERLAGQRGLIEGREGAA